MPFAIENIRLKELALIAEQNKGMCDDFTQFLEQKGYSSLHSFVISQDERQAHKTLLSYLSRKLPEGIILYDGIARPYSPEKAKWLMLGWMFRDAPEQRLKPMLRWMEGRTSHERQAQLFNLIRQYVAGIFPTAERWKWSVLCEVFIDRLEGSRRAIKGMLFEGIVRQILNALFKENGVNLTVSETEEKIEGETYDVKVSGKNGVILIPVKTRETMGGGHAHLFTRDIHKSISAAYEAGLECIPVIIAESWGGDLKTLACRRVVYINKNPNQVTEVRPLLVQQLTECLDAFMAVS